MRALALALVLLTPRLALPQDAPPDRIAELERRIDLLAQELEKTRAGEAARPEGLEGQKGLAPAASKVYGKDRGISFGGYGEILYEHPAGERDDSSPSGSIPRIDYLRQILYVGYKFSDHILFNSEIEFEHAKTDPGEVAVEFGYLEFQKNPALGARAGMLLVPMGFLNELHEPPIFHGAKRPEVERQILPSTWRENGGGLFGEAGPVEWRAYVLAGLDSGGFSAAGIREGRQEGAQSRARDLALTGRLDFTGVDGLLVGGSFFTGESGQGATTDDGVDVGARVTVFEGHVQYERRGLQLRALGAWTRVGDAALINAQNGLTGADSVGERQSGWYAQLAYDVMALRPAGRWSVSPFLRYEAFDTQARVPAGFERNPARDRRILTFGVGVKPLPNVALKVDYQDLRNEARTGVNQWNLAVGYLF